MAKWGKFDFSEFRRLAESFQKAADGNVMDQFVRDLLAEMAMRSVNKIKRRMTDQKIVDTGQLRRSWQVGSVEKQGDAYTVEIYNPVEYAPFVEYGHRTGPNLTKWVQGRFMMTISMNEIERELPAYLEKRMTQKLKEILGGKG